MKKTFLTIVSILICVAANATLNGNGYYRVKNYGSQRWASLVDNTGSVDLVASSADLHSLLLTNNTEEILADPGSIVYITNISGKQYDIAAQGTSLDALVDNPIYIGQNGTAPDGQALYMLYGSSHGVTKYIMDGQLRTNEPIGQATINDINAPNFKKWEIIPLDAAGDNYFGAVPTLTAKGKQYATLFTSFAYKPYSAGVKAYYVGRVGFGMAEIIQVSTVPTGSPVIIECAGSKVADNKLQIVGSQDAFPNNSLKGAYFDYNKNGFVNQVKYNRDTMRVLGTCADGSLGFVQANIDYIPANTAYLTVPAGSAPELKCVSTAEYEANVPEAPAEWYIDEAAVLLPQDDYTYTCNFSLPSISSGESKKIRFYVAPTKADNQVIGVYNAYGRDYSLNFDNKDITLPFSYNSPYYWVISNYPGGELSITLNLQTQSVKFSSKNTAVETIFADSSLKYQGGIIYGVPGEEIKVYDLSGKIVDYSTLGSLDISSLPKGIYIATAGGKTIKISH